MKDENSSPPLYVHLVHGEVAETRELVPGKVFTDHDVAGNIIGIEVLELIDIEISAPIGISDVSTEIETPLGLVNVPEGWARYNGP